MLIKLGNMSYFTKKIARKVTRIDTTMMTFGRNVQEARLALGISLEELAFRAGLHRTYIGMVERAERSISLQNAKKIADALEMKLDILLQNE